MRHPSHQQIGESMNASIKRLILGAAFLCSGVGQAAVVPADGLTFFNGSLLSAKATWSFSRYLTDALSIPPGADIGVYGGAWKEIIYYPTVDEFGEPYVYARHVVHSEVSTLDVDDATGALRAATASGGTKWVFSKSNALRIAGGQAEIGELDVRFQADGSANIFGSISGQALGATSSVSYTGLLFTVQASDVEGSISLAGQPGGNQHATLHNLVLSQGGFVALTESFGVNRIGLMYSALQFVRDDFGDLTLQVAAMPAIPEPSTGALLMGGLICLAALRRRSN